MPNIGGLPQDSKTDDAYGVARKMGDTGNPVRDWKPPEAILMDLPIGGNRTLIDRIAALEDAVKELQKPPPPVKPPEPINTPDEPTQFRPDDLPLGHKPIDGLYKTKKTMGIADRGIVEQKLAYGVLPAASSYSSTLKADTADPALGAGGTFTSSVYGSRRWIDFSGSVVLGAGGGGGTGPYYVTLPFTIASGKIGVGVALYYDSSATTYYVGVCKVVTNKLYFYSPLGQIAPLVPFAWANGDTLDFYISYPIV